ncbi:hypothetical protein SAM19_01356 [Brevibacillus laterosporus]|nr:hypothetical protein [Brevibacillus laterosporus]
MKAHTQISVHIPVFFKRIFSGYLSLLRVLQKTESTKTLTFHIQNTYNIRFILGTYSFMVHLVICCFILRTSMYTTHKKIAEKLVRLCALSIFLCIYPLFHSKFTFFISVFLQTILFISLVLEDLELTLSLLLDVRILVEE